MTANTPSPRLRLTLFDLDHTLLPIDSDHAWGAFTTRIGWTDPAEFGRRNDAFYADYQAGTLDVHDYVRFATAALRRHRPQALALVQRHQRAGDEVLIVTATNDFVTRPIALALGVGADGLLATQLARDASGWYSGEIDGWPCMRAGKLRRMEQWLAARQLAWEDVESRCYSDSMNDLPLLEKVDHPVAPNPPPPPP